MVSNVSTVLEPKTKKRISTSIEEMIIAVHKEKDSIILFEQGFGLNASGQDFEKNWHLVGTVTKEYLLAGQFYAENKIYKNITNFYKDINLHKNCMSLKFGDYEILLSPEEKAPKYIEPLLEALPKMTIKRRILSMN